MNCCFRKWKNHFLPSYTGNDLFLSIRISKNERTERLALLSLRANTDFVKQSFFNKAPVLFDTLSSDIRKQVDYEKLTMDLKVSYLQKYAAKADYSEKIIIKTVGVRSDSTNHAAVLY